MRVLLDECVPRRFGRELVGHDVRTVPQEGWSGKENGELLTRGLTFDRKVRAMKKEAPPDIDAYIAFCPPEVRPILEKIRATIRAAAPEAEEAISYRMPTFVRDGYLVHFATFKKHIGLFPPVRGDEKLEADLAPYRGEKGNLKFPLDEPMPYALIRRVVKARIKEQRERAGSKRGKT